MTIKGAKSLGVTYEKEFEVWQAAIASGATLDELEKIYRGEYDKRFLAMVVVRHRQDRRIEQHAEAMRAEMVKKASKRKR